MQTIQTRIEQLESVIQELTPMLESKESIVQQFEASLQTAAENKNVVLEQIDTVKEEKEYWQEVLMKLQALE